jgi:hypothetical protein
MNIFKVLASGKGSFQEEQASAIIAWLLNPRMEHGLGFAFLSRFVEAVAGKHTALNDISCRLSPRLRSGDPDEINWACYLEYNVESAFIDIALQIDDWVLAVENKIYPGSASDPTQLQREYDGLKIHEQCKNMRIGIIFLVPVNDNGVFDSKIDLEYANLTVNNNDFKCLITWNACSSDNLSPVPSISEIIVSILEDECKGAIEPIPEYTRHTLKAFNQFISNGFSGYDFQSETSSGGLNPLTEKRYDIKQLDSINAGSVGVKNGLSGLLGMDMSKLITHKFQYTTADMSLKNQWLDIDTFKNIVNWRIKGLTSDIKWEARLPAEALYNICRDYGNDVYVGIRGGNKALQNMEPNEIMNSRWNISRSQGSTNWINGLVFYSILKEKGMGKIFK